MSLKEDLCRSIKSWVEAGRHSNINVLSSKCSMPYSTLYKIAKGDIEYPQIESVVAILRVVKSRDERSEFLRKHYPSLAEDFGIDAHPANN